MGFLRLPLLVCGTGAIPAVLIAKTWGWDKDLEVYSFEGSSSMKATIDFLVKKYNEKNQGSIFSNVQSVGSVAGLEKLLEGSADFALISQDVTELATRHKQRWESKKLRTITLAKEAMVLLYKPPRNCSNHLDITKENVKYIYSAFSGHKHNSEKLDWSKLIEGCGGPITTWAKSSGPLKSGTAYTFVNNPLLKTEVSQDEDWLKKVKEGYGHDFKNIKYTSESNLLSWNNFVDSLSEGSLIYLPSSFVFNNINEIKDRGIKIAKLNGKEIDEKVNKDKAYNWGRTHNLVYSTSNLDDKKKKFLNWIIENLNVVEEINLMKVEGSQKKAEEPDGTSYGIPFLASQTSESLQQLKH